MEVGVVWNVEFRSVIVENTWKQTQFQSTQNSLNQYRVVPLPLHGVYLHIMSVRDMTIFNIWTWRTLPKPFIVETIQSRIPIGLSQHWLASPDNYSDCIHKYTCIEFMKFSNSTGPLTWSLSEYPKLEQSKAVRQKIHLSLEIFSDWRCTFSFESDHVHFTSPITPKMQNTANVFMSPLMQSVGLSPVCYALWTLRKFPNTNVHVLLHIKHQGKNAIS